jgi:hypothetical protein
MESPWRNEEVLRYLYIEKQLSAGMIADELGCSRSTVFKYMDRFEIERRSISEAMVIRNRKEPACYRMNSKGYMIWESTIGTDRKTAMTHRLLMVAEHGLEAVKGMDVHHENEIPWDNRLDNLELLTHEEHKKRHRKISWVDELAIQEMSGLAKQNVIGKHFDVSGSTVGRVLRGET